MEDPFQKYKELAKYKEGETARETELRIALITVQTYYEKEERNQKQLMDQALDHYSDDYQKLKRENEALRNEIHQLRQQQPIIELEGA